MAGFVFSCTENGYCQRRNSSFPLLYDFILDIEVLLTVESRETYHLCHCRPTWQNSSFNKNERCEMSSSFHQALRNVLQSLISLGNRKWLVESPATCHNDLISCSLMKLSLHDSWIWRFNHNYIGPFNVYIQIHTCFNVVVVVREEEGIGVAVMPLL